MYPQLSVKSRHLSCFLVLVHFSCSDFPGGPVAGQEQQVMSSNIYAQDIGEEKDFFFLL